MAAITRALLTLLRLKILQRGFASSAQGLMRHLLILDRLIARASAGVLVMKRFAQPQSVSISRAE
jgi:hypothetical protein